MGTRCRLAAATMTVVVALVAGCAGPRAMSGKQRLVPATHAFASDIPLPSGFELVDQSSADWSGDVLRCLRHRYRGGADKGAVETFYRSEMPLARWTPIGEDHTDGRIAMQFRKGKESCLITIEDEMHGLTRHVAVEVVIAPATGQRRGPGPPGL